MHRESKAKSQRQYNS